MLALSGYNDETQYVRAWTHFPTVDDTPQVFSSGPTRVKSIHIRANGNGVLSITNAAGTRTIANLAILTTGRRYHKIPSFYTPDGLRFVRGGGAATAAVTVTAFSL
jgi:hypothetical protein